MNDGYFLFTDRLEFSSGFEADDVVKQRVRETLTYDIDAYLQSGLEIEQVPYNPVPEIIARIGEWSAMGDELGIGDVEEGTEDY